MAEITTKGIIRHLDVYVECEYDVYQEPCPVCQLVRTRLKEYDILRKAIKKLQKEAKYLRLLVSPKETPR